MVPAFLIQSLRRVLNWYCNGYRLLTGDGRHVSNSPQDGSGPPPADSRLEAQTIEGVIHMGSCILRHKAGDARRALLATTSLLGILLTAPAFAQAGNTPQSSADQSANAQNTDTIIVTGIRGSMASAANLKQINLGVTESVVAEDIGKLPDLSVAESLARLPGVAAQRVDGRAQELSLRGMGPKFAVTLLNGNEIVSTGDDRSFQYDQLPAELVNTMTVYKTSDVSLGTQGLAGTIDIRTVHPLDVKGRKLAINARFEANSYGTIVPGTSPHGERLNATYIDQFLDGHLGLALGYAHLGAPEQNKYFNPWDYGLAGDLGVTGAGGAAIPGNPYALDGLELGVQNTKTARDSFLGVLEYRSDGSYHSVLNLLHTTFTEHMRGNEINATLANWAVGTTPVVTMNSSNPISETAANVTPDITFRGDDRKDSIDSIDWNNEVKFGEWQLTVDGAWSRAKRNETIAEAYASPNAPTTITATFASGFGSFGQFSSPLNFDNPALFSLSTYWGGGGGYESVVAVTDETKSGRATLHHGSFGKFLTGLDLGVIYAQRSKSLADIGTNYALTNGTPCILGSCAPVPVSMLNGMSSLGFTGAGNVMSTDIIADIAHSGQYAATPGSSMNQAYNWQVTEKVLTGFLKFSFFSHALIDWKATLGTQIVHVDQASTGTRLDANGNSLPGSGRSTYTNLLPSLMLDGDLGNRTQLRFGVSRNVARPSMSDMAANITASVSPSTTGATAGASWSGSGGNPGLKPWESTDFDVSLEKYLNHGTYVAVALFDKAVTRAILTESVAYNFAGYVNPTGLIPSSTIGTLTTPTNVSGGYVRGIELSASIDGASLTHALAGFGLSANYAYSGSSLPGTDASGQLNPSTTLDGLSAHVANATVFYEKNGWQFRIGERYRSGFSALRHNAFKLVVDTIRPEAITDMQAGYTLQSGPLKGLGMQLEANNVFDRPYSVSQTVNGQTVPQEFYRYGRQYLIGMNYKF